jgi:dihydrolipoamide dehydrogenase
VNSETFDAVVIGSGSGGLTAAIGLARFGKRIALVERGPVGGDCTNTGCIPSKRLIHLARYTGASASGASILADVRATRDGLSHKERQELEADPNITLIVGHGTLAGTGQVVVRSTDGERTISAPHIIIATGSRPHQLEIPGLPADRLLTNETLFELTAPPVHLAVVGAGAIGLEMAMAFRRLGSRVTVIDIADRVLPTADPAASPVIHEALEAMDITVHLSARTGAYAPTGGRLTLETPGEDVHVPEVDAVLVAVGRRPNIDDIGLEHVGITPDADGIPVDGWGRTSAKGIWAVGDVTPGSHTTHEANASGRRIIQRIALPWLPPIGSPPPIPSAVFTDPEVAWVGLTHAQVARRYHASAVTRITVALAATDRGLTDGLARGFVSIDAIRLTGRIIGATIVGPNASDLIATVALAMNRGISLLRLSRQTYAYPTFAGAIGAAGDEFARATLPHLRREAGAYLRFRRRRPPSEGVV